MLTRIEIDGFKSFEQFSLDVAPFTVIADLSYLFPSVMDIAFPSVIRVQFPGVRASCSLF